MAWEGCLAQGLGQKCVWVLCANIRVCWIWGCLRTRTRKQIPLTAALEETSGKGTTQDYAECLLAQTQLSFTVSCSNLLLFGGLQSGVHGPKAAAWKVEPQMLHSLRKWSGARKILRLMQSIIQDG